MPDSFFTTCGIQLTNNMKGMTILVTYLFRVIFDKNVVVKMAIGRKGGYINKREGYFRRLAERVSFCLWGEPLDVRSGAEKSLV